MARHDDQRRSGTDDNAWKSIHAWQDRIRSPGLTVLLAFEIGATFLAAPPMAPAMWNLVR
jgi:hypothetical protein